MRHIYMSLLTKPYNVLIMRHTYTPYHPYTFHQLRMNHSGINFFLIGFHIEIK